MELSQTPWVPVQACTLPSTGVPLRLAEFDDLLASLHDLDRRNPTWLRLRLDGGDAVERQARDLTAEESRCCSFFEFTVERDSTGRVVVEVRVPADRTEVLDGLERRAGVGRAVR